MRLSKRRALGLLSLVLATGLAGTVVAQSGLSLGGSQSNYGRKSLSGGFTPDPSDVSVVSGGSLNSSTMSLGAGCTGYVTRQPDFILDYDDAANFLRFYVTGTGDTTLLVNDAAGRWHCNDDSHGGTNPTVDLRNPPEGQYDIWVGSYEANANLRGTLHITELASRHP